jgi:hypothetical protein
VPEVSIEERILDAFPSGNYGLLALLRLLDIVETDEVDTAAVDCVAFPRLLINPEFVKRQADTPERLLMLVMHELHHVLLGHTRLFPRLTPTDNLIFDAVINALLCRMFPGKEYTSFFTNFYRDDAFPECLLRPAENWSPHGPVPVPPALAGDGINPIRECYRLLYSETGATYHELFEAMRGIMDPPSGTGPMLIGSHGQEIPELGGTIFDVVRSVVENWPQPPRPIAGRSWSELLDLSRVTCRRSNRTELRTILRKVAGPGRGARLARRSPVLFPVVSPIPASDRRAIVLRALGVPQLLYRSEVPSWRAPSCERVHIYLDVSGSIGNYKGALYGAVIDCAEIVHPQVHLFSTAVHDISLEQLRRGECRTTGGTSIECVARHMRTNRVRRAVLLTDGAVGRPGTSARETMVRATLGVAFTPGYNLRTDLEPFTRYWTQLYEEKN